MKKIIKSKVPFPEATPAGTAPELERELERLNAEGATLCRQIEDLEGSRDAIEDADELMSAMARVTAAQNKRRRIDGEIAVIRERLGVARSAVRAELLVGLKGDLKAAAQEFQDHAAVMSELTVKLQAARAAISAAGFNQEALGFPPPPMTGEALIVAPDLLNIFAQTYARTLGTIPSKLQPAPPQRHASGIAPQIQANSAPGVGRFSKYNPLGMGQAAPSPINTRAVSPSPRLMPRPLFSEEPTEGKALFAVLRDGVENPDRGQLRLGDKIALTEAAARPLLMAGAITQITAALPAQADAAVALHDGGQE